MKERSPRGPRFLPRMFVSPMLGGIALLMLAALGPASSRVAGQTARPERPDRARPLPYLLDVGDATALVRYSPGALDRASHVQNRFSLLARDFNEWSKLAVPLGAVLLSRTDWEALDLAVPYGLPARLSNGEVALCAWGDQGTVALWQALLGGGLPQLDGHPLHGSQAEASSLLLTDLLSQGVAARTLLERAGLTGADPRVVNLTAHVVALGASHRHERLALGDLRRVYMISAPDPAAGEPTGDDVWRALLAGERPYYEAAQALIAKRGVSKAAKAMLKLLRKSGPRLTTLEVAKKFPEVAGLLPGTAAETRGKGRRSSGG